MNIPDPVATGLAVVAIQQIAKQGQDFLAAAGGRKGESLGTILGDLTHRRLQNLGEVSTKSHFILLDIGVAAAEVSLDVFQPLLEGASVQENPELQDIWANMLANAADPRQTNPVRSLFPEILKSFSAREVKFIDLLFKSGSGKLQMQMPMLHHTYRSTKLPSNEIPYYAGPPQLNAVELNEFEITIDIVTRAGVLAPNEEAVLGPYRFTKLGVSFVNACRRPQK